MMDDLISRQAAIEAIAGAIWHYPNPSFLSNYDHAHGLAEDALKWLPSAQPERRGQGRSAKMIISNGKPLPIAYACRGLSQEESEALELVRKYGAENIQPVRRGQWVKEIDRRNHWHCSKCGYVIGILRVDAKYCLNCGAIMEAEDG